jgi:hypothetical protein
VVLPTVPNPTATSFNSIDTFGTHNQFYGPQIAARAEFGYRRLFLDVTGKIALGEDHEVVNIHGVTSSTTPDGVRTVVTQGLLAQPTNSGHYSRNEFAPVPEVTCNLGYQLTGYLGIFLGYNFLYISHVVRPGDQIDPNVNTSQVPLVGKGTLTGAAVPAFLLKNNDFWAEGLNFGVEVKY